VEVASVGGRIEVLAGTGGAVTLETVKRGGTAHERARLRVELTQGRGALRVRTRCPRITGCGGARVDYRLTVPAAARVAARTVSGRVDVSGVTGPVEARSVSGPVAVRGVTGTIRARSVSGTIRLELPRRAAAVRAGSVSGNVTVLLGPGVGADLRLATLSGRLRTSLPVRGRRVRGGGLPLRVGTVSGNLSLLPL
jgi:hypothetical protein